jgi:hypothetical protein
MKMEELEFYPALAAIFTDPVDHSLHEHFAMYSRKLCGSAQYQRDLYSGVPGELATR